MNEPSEEAKQAAEKAGYLERPRMIGFTAYCAGYDAASAKLRKSCEGGAVIASFGDKLPPELPSREGGEVSK